MLSSQSFIYTQFNAKHFYLKKGNLTGHLFAHSLNVPNFYLTLLGATSPSQTVLGTHGNEEFLCIL